MRLGVLVLVVVAPAHAQLLRPCRAASADAQVAIARIDAFAASLAARSPRESEGLEEEFYALFEGPCLAVGMEIETPLFDSVPSAQRWWAEGGQEWMRSLIGRRNVLVVPPDPRRALGQEAVGEHPWLASLLCSLDDAACIAETDPWRDRFEAAMARLYVEDKWDRPWCPEDCARPRPGIAFEVRWNEWATCVQHSLPRRPRLPLGGLRAPSHGWLVVSTQVDRGSRSSLYDLATGELYAIERRVVYVFDAHGEIDWPATHATPEEVIGFTGRVPVDVLSDAARSALFGQFARDEALHLARVPGPRGLVRGAVVVGLPLRGSGVGLRGTSDGSHVPWRWIDGDSVASGDLDRDGRPDERAAIEAIDGMEAARVAGCPRTLTAAEVPAIEARYDGDPFPAEIRELAAHPCRE